MNKILDKMVESITNYFKDLSNVILNTIKDINLNPLTNALKGISEVLESINLSEKQKKVLIERYCSYGKYGWTIPPQSPLFLNRKATSLSQADTHMLQFCKNKDMIKIFDKLQKNPLINDVDLNEAIKSYKQKSYKSCALLLFSLIDGILIKIQDKSSTRRTVASAAKKITGIIDEKEKFIYLFLNAQNVISAINTIYESPKDFSKHFDCVNRDTVSHGMVNRAITKVDCIKIFILLYNIVNLINFYKITTLK